MVRDTEPCPLCFAALYGTATLYDTSPRTPRVEEVLFDYTKEVTVRNLVDTADQLHDSDAMPIRGTK